MKLNQKTIYILSILLLIFCIQTTDLKIGFVKISEIILLLIAPYYLLNPINKYLFYLLMFFTISLVITFFITIGLDFEVLGKSKVKAPYIISIGRYIELVACIVLGLVTLKIFKTYQNKKIINLIVNINVYLTMVYVLIYLLVIFKIIPQDSSIVVYESQRLRGLYFEGGPFGLMLGFIFILTFLQDELKHTIIKRLFLMFVIVFMARSKAGVMISIIWVMVYYLNILLPKLKPYKYKIILLTGIIFYFAAINIGEMYINQIAIIKKAVKERPQDPYLILGRLSAVYIVPNMVMEHPLLGIGIGNYPLLRNNKNIRSFFPLPPRKIIDIDSHGCGGIVDVLVDMGILGLCAFLSIVYLLYKEMTLNKQKAKILLIPFLFIFLFGVQLYFLYPWIFLGIILACKNNYLDEISN